jgi:hypothetical protein
MVLLHGEINYYRDCMCGRGEDKGGATQPEGPRSIGPVYHTVSSCVFKLYTQGDDLVVGSRILSQRPPPTPHPSPWGVVQHNVKEAYT